MLLLACMCMSKALLMALLMWMSKDTAEVDEQGHC